MIHKLFNANIWHSLRILLCVFAVFMAVHTVYAEDDLYTVENIVVDKTAENAVIARDAAIVEGQRRAFEFLMRRLLLEAEENAALSNLDDLEISSMINDFETGQEKFSSKRYRAVMTVRFNPQAVKNYLGKTGNRNVVETRGKAVLVLPYLTEADKTFLWSRENPWMKEWQTVSTSSGLVPIVVPHGDVDDAAAVSEDNVLIGDQGDISYLLNRYNTDRLLLPLAEEKNGAIDVKVYEYIGAELSLVKSLSVTGNEDNWAEAIRGVRDYINSDWKTHLKYSGDVTNERMINMNVKYKSMQDWLQLQRTLLAMPEVENIQTKNFNRNKASVLVNLTVDPNDFANALISRNLVLNKVKDRTGFGAAAQPATYDLVKNVSTYEYPNYQMPAPQVYQETTPVIVPRNQNTLPNYEGMVAPTDGQDRYPVVAPPVQNVPVMPSVAQPQTQIQGAYEYQYRPQVERNTKDWDNTYERP